MSRHPTVQNVPVLNRALPEEKPKVGSRIEIPRPPVVRSNPVVLPQSSTLDGNYKKMMDSVKDGSSAIDVYIADKVKSKPVQKEIIIYDRADRKWKLVTVVDGTT